MVWRGVARCGVVWCGLVWPGARTSMRGQQVVAGPYSGGLWSLRMITPIVANIAVQCNTVYLRTPKKKWPHQITMQKTPAPAGMEMSSFVQLCTYARTQTHWQNLQGLKWPYKLHHLGLNWLHLGRVRNYLNVPISNSYDQMCTTVLQLNLKICWKCLVDILYNVNKVAKQMPLVLAPFTSLLE